MLAFRLDGRSTLRFMSTTNTPRFTRFGKSISGASIVLGLSATAALVPAAKAANESYTVALIGDYNYGPLNGPLWQESERMIADINTASPSFVIHNGDTKAGGNECTDEINVATKAQFDRVKSPLVYLFGDNEWTDCHRILATVPKSAFGDPFERLDNLRRVFYPNNQSQGGTKMTLVRQADVDKQFVAYVENVRWVKGPVMFIGLNVPGSNNNCAGGPLQVTRIPSLFECTSREPAVLKWLSDSFAEAKRLQLRGVFIAQQGNPDFENKRSELPTYDNNGYKRLIKTIQTEVSNFNGQVVLTHGDSHSQRFDTPLTDVIDVRDGTETGKVMGSFRRVETFGNPETHWIRMTVDPTKPELFSFERKVVAGNPVPKPLAP